MVNRTITDATHARITIYIFHENNTHREHSAVTSGRLMPPVSSQIQKGHPLFIHHHVFIGSMLGLYQHTAYEHKLCVLMQFSNADCVCATGTSYDTSFGCNMANVEKPSFPGCWALNCSYASLLLHMINRF